MTRTIDVSVEVFQRIWSLWQHGEKTEDEILRRVLWSSLDHERGQKTLQSDAIVAGVKSCTNEAFEGNTSKLEGNMGMPALMEQVRFGKTRWVDDVREALRLLGDEGDLAQIYRVVRQIRTRGGRSLPESLDATIRQCIEAHSSDSENFEDRGDYFAHVGRGRWKLR